MLETSGPGTGEESSADRCKCTKITLGSEKKITLKVGCAEMMEECGSGKGKQRRF
jgi:hypothetical protein